MGEQRVALITGASSGIGQAVCEKLSNGGFVVYGTSRKAAKEIITKTDAVNMIYMDVTDEQSVNDAIDMIYQSEGRLDVLVNNAGYGIAGAVEDTSDKEAKALFAANFFGSLSTIRASFVLLQKSRGIIINISSVAGIITVPFQGMYSAGKAAMEAISESLRMEAKPYGVRVCIVEPGDTKTGFTQNRMWTQKARGSKYEQTMKKSIEKMEHDEQNGAPPEAVANLVYKMINMKNPPVRKAVGASYRILIFLKRFLPDRLILWILGKMYA